MEVQKERTGAAAFPDTKLVRCSSNCLILKLVKPNKPETLRGFVLNIYSSLVHTMFSLKSQSEKKKVIALRTSCAAISKKKSHHAANTMLFVSYAVIPQKRSFCWKPI